MGKDVSINDLLFKPSRNSSFTPSKVEREFLSLSKRKMVNAPEGRLRIGTHIDLSYAPVGITELEDLPENTIREIAFNDNDPESVKHRKLSPEEALQEIEDFKAGLITPETDKGRFK